MAQARGNLYLFGFDLARLPAFLRQGWSVALRWPFFARLLPPEPVRVLGPTAGGDTMWPPAADRRAAIATAIVLPEDILLRRRLRLPFLPAAARKDALELALAGASPFPAGQTVWGWRAAPDATGETVELVLASKNHVNAHLEGVLGTEGLSLADVEAWAVAGDEGEPVVLQGYGEERRLARARRRLGWSAASFFLVLVLLLALAASPVVRMRQDVFDLNGRLDAVSREVAPVLADRDALAKANLQLQAGAVYAAARPDPVEVLGRLSTMLPDSAYLTRFDLRGHVVLLNGLAENAAGLMETLGEEPGFRDVKAPAAITRDPASGRETFSIEFRFDDLPGSTAPGS
jgi:general secretion pathway protein L